MKDGPTFRDVLIASAQSWRERTSDECVLSLALPIKGIDPLRELPFLADGQQFRFLWDGTPGLCFSATGHCQYFDLGGARRFELAQRFSDATFGRLIDVTPAVPSQARPRILLAFSFFDQTAERQRSLEFPPGTQAVLPRWQLSTQGGFGWLRLNGVVTHEAEARELAERLWLMRSSLGSARKNEEVLIPNDFSGVALSSQWQGSYYKALIRGIELVNSGSIEKIVLAARQSILLEKPLDPLVILSRLRHQQAGSCRFLWQRSSDQSFFGASPERLLSLSRGQLRIDALAGTASIEKGGENLLNSDKDRREHQLVVDSIVGQLVRQGLEPQMPLSPELFSHGHLVHLHTPITAASKGLMPLHLADALHPTPAVAGFPRRDAMSWLRTLEPFERGNYAAPIGWIDNSGRAELRVAIRSGNSSGKKLELTAGAGLVRGSVAEKELQEVGLKLGVLAQQLELQHDIQSNSLSKFSRT